ncbi:hypothetical protein BO78DRAFT_317824 [Aspergillus sclerotiicarbonarius CBS 121057]|uniref:PD-(D/E)XK nuclease-like domain-containing protein n=1 Tax=Aspergillus sclerotiicarbonarius (strain CBS 121057 / IBT 28362) TaxID=1448318 RepID=A0A319ECK7_ASPSB|nr:hypothetical protein BO78DRAFT_317824 [Aspergillus sclerotiicarbonarius CBS 121057]
MGGDERHAIEQWIDGVLPLQPSSYDSEAGKPLLDDTQKNAQRKRKFSETPVAQPNAQKRPRCERSVNALPCPGSFRNDISLPPSLARSASNRQSFNPIRVKAQLATATPKVVLWNENMSPGCDAALRLLVFLTSDDNAYWGADMGGIKKISNTSNRYATQLRSEGSWVMDVARPLLDLAIDDLPLESWNVYTESVGSKYMPRHTAKDAFNCKLDLVVGLPKIPWVRKYKQAGADIFGRDLSHVDHPYTGKRIIGLGVEVKASDGNLVEAQVQLAGWMASLVSWGFASRCDASGNAGNVCIPPPMVGCTVIGQDWKFYIVYGIAGASNQLSEVRVWGPLSDLNGQATRKRHTAALAKTLRRVMQYIRGSYAEQLFSLLTQRH